MTTLRWLLAAVHLVALGIGFAAIWGRRRALLAIPEPSAIGRVLYADTWWGIAAALWIATGLVRLIGGYDKPAIYYMHNHWFLAKMGCLALILILEVAPMLAFIQWRVKLAKHETVDTSKAKLFARISAWQTALVVIMVGAAAAMARGLGMP